MGQIKCTRYDSLHGYNKNKRKSVGVDEMLDQGKTWSLQLSGMILGMVRRHIGKMESPVGVGGIAA